VLVAVELVEQVALLGPAVLAAQLPRWPVLVVLEARADQLPMVVHLPKVTQAALVALLLLDRVDLAD
jgi:hypothetical protein